MSNSVSVSTVRCSTAPTATTPAHCIRCETGSDPPAAHHGSIRSAFFPTLPWKVTAGTTDSWRVTGAGAVKGYLVWKYPHLNQYRIYIHPQGEDWAGLLRRLSDMPDLPSRRPDSKSVRHRPVGRRAQKPVPDTNRQPVVPLPAIDAFPVAAQGHRAHLLERFRSGRPDRGNPIGRLLRRHRRRSRKRGHLHSRRKASVTRVRNPADDNPATGAPSWFRHRSRKRLPPGLSVPNRRPPPQRLLHRPLPHPLTSHPFHRSDKTTVASGRIPRPPAGQSKPTFYIGRHSPPTSKPNSAWATVGR